MNTTFEALARSWTWDPWLFSSLALAAAVYLRGWWALHRRDPQRFSTARLTAYLGGLTAVLLALASPLEALAPLLLVAHMAQHMLLMLVAPPLIWLGAPLLPMLRGLGREVRSVWAAPLLRSPWLRALFGRLTHPLVAGPLFVLTNWLWHVPRAYQLALDDPAWHVAEHACFFVAALLFWYPVVRPYPSRPRWSPWLLLPYLILADVQNTLLAAWLTFSPRPIYDHYMQMPRVVSLSALADQSAAGVLMWVPGSLLTLAPLVWIGMRLFYPGTATPRAPRRSVQPTAPALATMSLPIVTRTSGTLVPPLPTAKWDLLRLPVLGCIARWRFTRPLVQTCLLVLAVLVVVDGMWGPPASAMNLAGVLPWTHGRGLVVLGLVLAGNGFCYACPFTLPRAFARRWLPRRRSWPRALRHKWLAVAAIGLLLWSYEAFALWDSPWWTAWIVLGYFAVAVAIEGFFADAAFCKYVCPVGQFNFVQSLVSPLEVRVRSSDVCHGCTTRECIRGSARVPGCEMHLFQPRKAGNMDCTFCLDCVRACPHTNVGVLLTAPGRSLWSDVLASGVGRLSKRPDIATLVVLLTFGAFANAAGMVAPVVAWQDRLQAATGQSRLLFVSLYYVTALVVLPSLALWLATVLSRLAARSSEGLLALTMRYCYALVPLGLAMWIAHYSFHLLTSYGSIVPVSQRFAADWQLASLGVPEWQRACCTAVADWIPRFELVVLDLGLLGSLYAVFRIAQRQTESLGVTLRAAAPWAIVVGLLFVTGAWIVLQPMEMRGTLNLAGSMP